MTKMLDMSGMISAARELNVENIDALVADFERAGAAIAQALADNLDIQTWDATWSHDTGLVASFGPSTPDQECPSVIDMGDEDGEWEYSGSAFGQAPGAGM